MAKPIVTQEQLKKLVHYNPETGIFTWLPRPPEDFKLISHYHRFANNFANKECGILSYNGYRTFPINNVMYLAHRLAFVYMIGRFPHGSVDHDNRIRHDNRWENLKEKTQLENLRNMTMTKSNTSGVNGVSYVKATGKWRASVSLNNKAFLLGDYTEKKDAVLARLVANKVLGFHERHGLPFTPAPFHGEPK